MSTFNGIVHEFPDIRVDFFRNHPDIQPPLACFLSHIHSDHLAGLESLRSPFVYCSAATRELLLRLERYPCRINYAKGIIEARVQRYKHLKTLLKPIPLETPTFLELEPGNSLQVTLFDANHCPGAVMFLLEGSGQAVLYTGDIRSEPWFVNSVARNPCLIEYSSGIKTLDMIYLDTSFTEDIDFQTKAQGIKELVRKVLQYPPDTVFFLQAWTYGYEDVWIALSKALNSKIHADDYKMRIYKSLVVRNPTSEATPQTHLCPEAARLVGFQCGNTPHAGCLTSDDSVRLHSCEKGTYCKTIQSPNVVWIQPVIARLPNGQTLTEVGVGGGGDDLEREAELEYLSPEEIQEFFQMIWANDSITEDVKARMQSFLLQAVTNGRNVSLDIDISTFDEQHETKLANAIRSIAQKSELGRGKQTDSDAASAEVLPRKIRFPYSRHSSYPELCDLVQTFRPKDIWPCTVSQAEWLLHDVSIRKLFGQHCSGTKFRYDIVMQDFADRGRKAAKNLESQATTTSDIHESSSQLSQDNLPSDCTKDPSHQIDESHYSLGKPPSPHLGSELPRNTSMASGPREQTQATEEREQDDALGSQLSDLSETAIETRAHAFDTMITNATTGDWQPIGLLSTTDNHTYVEQDLGHG